MKVIVARDLSYAIGKNDELPWKLSDDLKYFKALTTGQTILMGRKTYESIGRPLPNRRNLVLSRDRNLKIEGCEVVHDFYEVLEKEVDLFVIGGEQLYEIALPLCKELHLTVVNTRTKGATAFFPKDKLSDWQTIEHRKYQKDDKNEFSFSYYHMIRL